MNEALEIIESIYGQGAVLAVADLLRDYDEKEESTD